MKSFIVFLVLLSMVFCAPQPTHKPIGPITAGPATHQPAFTHDDSKIAPQPTRVPPITKMTLRPPVTDIAA